MKVICLVAFLPVGCKPEVKRPPILLASNSAATVFTDSTIYRVQCKEADSLKTLNPIPRKCTPRDQRVKVY